MGTNFGMLNRKVLQIHSYTLEEYKDAETIHFNKRGNRVRRSKRFP